MAPAPPRPSATPPPDGREGRGLEADRTPPLWLRRTVAVLAALLFVVHVAARDDGAPWNGDAVQYTIHAENLVDGRPYAETGHLINADRTLMPVAYPPGYPLMLTPIVALGGRSRAAVGALQAACLAASAWLFAALYWRRLSPAGVVGLVLLVGLSPFLSVQVNAGYTALPFLAAVGLALVAIDRSGRAATSRQAILWAVAAGLAGGGAILVRALGVVLVPAFVVPALGRTRRATLRPALVAAAVAVVVALGVLGAADWEVGGQVVTGSRDDTGYDEIAEATFGRGAARVPRHVAARAVGYARMDREVLWALPEAGRWVHLPLRLLGLLVLGVGVWASARRVRPAEAFAALYLLALMPWSFGWPRYLVPVVPILYAVLLLGAERIWTWAERGRAVAAVPLAACGVLLVPFLSHGVGRMVDRVADGPSPVRPAGFELVAQATPPEAIVLTTRVDPRPLIFATGRRASTAPEDTAAWRGYARRVGAEYVLATGDRPRAAAWAAASAWRLVARDEAADLYAADSAAARPGTAPGTAVP
ncbi:hypothetical protein [Rubrivirga sp.]|uniref:hypothetical protein n=1 Tax=Rubrivirga sp. TaxID=1885344 RepID=UPI003B52D2DD